MGGCGVVFGLGVGVFWRSFSSSSESSSSSWESGSNTESEIRSITSIDSTDSERSIFDWGSGSDKLGRGGVRDAKLEGLIAKFGCLGLGRWIKRWVIVAGDADDSPEDDEDEEEEEEEDDSSSEDDSQSPMGDFRCSSPPDDEEEEEEEEEEIGGVESSGDLRAEAKLSEEVLEESRSSDKDVKYVDTGVEPCAGRTESKKCLYHCC